MTLDDIEILAKKITIGVLIYLIPVVIIVGGLTLTNLILKKEKPVAVKNQLK